MNVKLLSIDDIVDFELYKRFLPLASSERQERVMAYRRPESKIQSLLAELFIRQELACRYHIPFCEVLLDYAEHGKPYWKGDDMCHFSLSHSHDKIAVALHSSAIGVDIEKIQPVKQRIARRFFTEEEYRAIRDSSHPDAAFFEIWTKKEAYVKMTGAGLSTSFRTFSVLDEELSGLFGSLCLDDFQIAVCCDEPVPLSVTCISSTRLLEQLQIFL